MNRSNTNRLVWRRGGALLAVLWLSAALSAIAFAVAMTVRGEVGRTETAVESLRAHYLATGALDRAYNYLLYGPGPMMPDGRVRFWQPGTPVLPLFFPEGVAMVEVIPESARLSVNLAPEEEIFRLLMALGVPDMPAREITMAIVDWRTPPPDGGLSAFDRIYLTRTPSFRAPHASFEQIEELLSVHGITPELFHGRYDRLPDGTFVARPGLRDCLSVYSNNSALDINAVEPEVMLAVGAPPSAVEMIVANRRAGPLTPQQFNVASIVLGSAAGRFRVGGDRIYTLQAFARPRRPDGQLSDLVRSASMTVQLNTQYTDLGTRVLQYRESTPGARMRFELWPQ
jgi:general secretion pathway protein K